MANDMNADTVPALLIGRYRIEGPLGEGGLGTVVKAFDTRLKRTVAIKTLKRSGYGAEPDLFRALEERFAREAEAGSRMGMSQNLVTVYDLAVDAEQTQYLILEYVPGGSLADRIRRGPLMLPDALRLTAEIARGLQAAHNAGVVHRDIKPANIFIGEDGRAQVGDFGIAQIDEISGRTHSVSGHPGTPLYMSPEQAHSTGYVRASSDQYSLGLVLFEMLTGIAYKRLEKREVDALLTSMHPPSVRALIERMLASEPGNRYAGMTAVLAALKAIHSTSIETSENAFTLATAPSRGDSTVHATPRINMVPMSPVPKQPMLPPPAIPLQSAVSRRAVLAGIGGLVLAGGAASGAILASRGKGGHTATATQPLSASPSLTASTPPPTAPTAIPATPTTGPTPTMIVAIPPIAPSPIASTPSLLAGLTPPSPVTSLLSYLDGRVTLPGEGEVDGNIVGDRVQVVGVDLSRNEPSKLTAVTAPVGSRVVRTLWSPKGSRLATLVRQPVVGGFSKTLDLVVTDVATGDAVTVAKDINTLPSWSPDSTALVYAKINGREAAAAPFTGLRDAYDIHVVNADGGKDRTIARLVVGGGGCGGGGSTPDPIQVFLANDQFIGQAFQTAWAADNSLIALTITTDSPPHGISGTFTLRPDGSDVRQINYCQYPDLSPIIGATTSDPYVPANGLQITLLDDEDALHWRYERGIVPVDILDGCTPQTTSDGAPTTCDNLRKGSKNAGYRNQLVARLPDGTARTLTNSPTFKYHVAPSPDGTIIAFTGITVTDYAAAAARDTGITYETRYKPFTGFSTDVYVCRIGGGSETKISTSGAAHHASWERDIAVKAIPIPTSIPATATPIPPTLPVRAPAQATAARQPTNTQQTDIWKDPQGRIQIRYPHGWKVTLDSSSPGNLLELDGPDNVFFYINIYRRESPAGTALQGFHARHSASTSRNYNDEAIINTRVGGAPGATMRYSSKLKDGSDPHTGAVWYVDSGSNQFVFEVYAVGTTATHADEINAIIASVTFTA